MSQQVVTELVIDADTSGVDRFSQAMAGAEQAAASGTQSLTGFSGGIVAMGGGALAAGLALKGMLDYVVSANKGLADMQTVAHQVGLTLTDFQGIQFGGAIKGLSADQLNAGLEKSASLLNDASRNSNSLSKELEANGLSVKNANGQLISENQLLGIAANLIKNAANPGDQLAIAQMLGFTKEWIPLLEQGAGAMSGLAAEAKAAGAIIDDSTIQKAAEFDTQWRKSSVEFSSYMKAALVGLLPFVDDLIEGASKWFKSLPGTADVKKAVDDNNKAIDKAIQDSTGLPMESDAIAIQFTVSPAAQATWDTLTTKIGKAYDLLKWLSQDENTQKLLNGYCDQLAKTGGYLAGGGPLFNGLDVGSGGSNFPIKAKFIDPNSVPGFAASQITEPSYPTQEQMDAAFAKKQKERDWADDAAGDAADGSGGYSKVAAKDVAGDAVDRAINSLRKHTETQIADTHAVGLGDAALAGFRSTAAETAAVQANQGKETEAQVISFAKARDAAIAAADAFAKAKVATQIDFNSKTALLSADDVAIATQLKGIYGNDVPKALDSTYASAIRMNTAMKGVSNAIETNLTTGLTDITMGTKSASQGFRDMGLAIVKAIDEMIIKMLIVQPLMRSLGLSSLTSLGTSGSIVLGGPGGPGIFPSANGNIFDGGNVIPFAQGGMVDSPTMAPMALFGEKGPEAIVPLRRGADGNLGIASSGGGNSTTHVWNIDATGADSGTVERLKSVVVQLSSVVQNQGRAMTSQQRYQATGVG
jgi:hypothetical protein